MPCYEQNLISVDLKAADHDMLLEAITAAGMTYNVVGKKIEVKTPIGQITITDGKATFVNPNCQIWLNKLKQSYSLKSIEQIAKKYKFNIIQKDNKITLRKY